MFIHYICLMHEKQNPEKGVIVTPHTAGICRSRPEGPGRDADVDASGPEEEAACRGHQQQAGGGAKGHEHAAANHATSKETTVEENKLIS